MGRQIEQEGGACSREMVDGESGREMKKSRGALWKKNILRFGGGR